MPILRALTLAQVEQLGIRMPAIPCSRCREEAAIVFPPPHSDSYVFLCARCAKLLSPYFPAEALIIDESGELRYGVSQENEIRDSYEKFSAQIAEKMAKDGIL